MILNENKNLISFSFPGKLAFGNGCFDAFVRDFADLNLRNVFVVCDPALLGKIKILSDFWEASGKKVKVNSSIKNEPGLNDFQVVLQEAEEFNADAVVGIGGGSILDVAKLVAALCRTGIPVESVFGSGKIEGRRIFLACLPTTSGTGSEVSPNSILFDANENLKKAVISPFLVPDATYVDPLLTCSVPRHITAATGIDALTHCIEAYANKFAHPITDLFALEGIRLIFNNLEKAYNHPSDAEARSHVALGSLYGGLCLGSVNTAGVHALAYPLGSRFHLAHGLSNGMLLLHVLQFNLPEGTSRYASVARALGVDGPSEIQAAEKGLELIADLCREVQIPEKLTAFNVSKEDIPILARSAMSVERLLKNNLRTITEEDAQKIYQKLF